MEITSKGPGRASGVLHRWLAPLVAVSALACESEAPASTSLVGVWEADRYLLATGQAHPLRGHIFFQDGQWSVLFFVLDEAGEARRGSAEGGLYFARADTVTFEHLYNLSAGEAMAGLEVAPLRLVARESDGPTEPTLYHVDGASLTLSFPSGNRMSFRKPAPR